MTTLLREAASTALIANKMDKDKTVAALVALGYPRKSIFDELRLISELKGRFSGYSMARGPSLQKDEPYFEDCEIVASKEEMDRNACEDHLADLRLHHPVRDPAKGHVSRPSGSVMPPRINPLGIRSFSGSPAALTADA